MKIVDPNNWPRKTSYKTFIDYSDPSFSITTRLDVTRLWNRCKDEGMSFFTDFLYIVMRQLNDIEEFRTRLLGDQIVVYDVVHPGFVVIKEDESITSARVEMVDDYPEFYNKIRDAIDYTKAHTSIANMNEGFGNDVVFISCLPWMDFTSITNPYDHSNKESCSIPRITWGKVMEDSEHKTMAFDVSAHHSLVDGYQVYKLVKKIQDSLDSLDLFI